MMDNIFVQLTFTRIFIYVRKNNTQTSITRTICY